MAGIIFLIVGTVAFIEERGEINLGLGIPAGLTVVIAAGMYEGILLTLEAINLQKCEVN